MSYGNIERIMGIKEDVANIVLEVITCPGEVSCGKLLIKRSNFAEERIAALIRILREPSVRDGSHRVIEELGCDIDSRKDLTSVDDLYLSSVRWIRHSKRKWCGI